jgi:hypothetical protein
VGDRSPIAAHGDAHADADGSDGGHAREEAGRFAVLPAKGAPVAGDKKIWNPDSIYLP